MERDAGTARDLELDHRERDGDAQSPFDDITQRVPRVVEFEPVAVEAGLREEDLMEWREWIAIGPRGCRDGRPRHDASRQRSSSVEHGAR